VATAPGSVQPVASCLQPITMAQVCCCVASCAWSGPNNGAAMHHLRTKHYDVVLTEAQLAAHNAEYCSLCGVLRSVTGKGGHTCSGLQPARPAQPLPPMPQRVSRVTQPARPAQRRSRQPSVPLQSSGPPPLPRSGTALPAQPAQHRSQHPALQAPSSAPLGPQADTAQAPLQLDLQTQPDIALPADPAQHASLQPPDPLPPPPAPSIRSPARVVPTCDDPVPARPAQQSAARRSQQQPTSTRVLRPQ
jgi:hypothetical protein